MYHYKTFGYNSKNKFLLLQKKVMEILLNILVLVWAILCVILFFKVWKTCNRYGISFDRQSAQFITAREAVLYCQSNAHELLTLECGKALYKAAKQTEVYPETKREDDMNAIIASYKPIFESIGKKMPEHMTSPDLFFKRIEELGL